MKHIKLHNTHRLLFRILLGLSIGAVVIGSGILAFPDYFFGRYQVIKDTAPSVFWGILWLSAGVTTLAGLWRYGYALVRIGAATIATLLFTWTVGLLTNQIFNITPDALIGVVVYLVLAGITVATLLEPPINASTALKVTRDEK